MILSIKEYDEDPVLIDDRGSSEQTLDDSSFRREYILDTSLLSDPGKSNSQQSKIFQRNHGSQQRVQNGRKGVRDFWNRLCRIFVELFLPIGYPHCVDASYLPYQLYDGLQGLCSYWRGVVATRAVLEAAGVGNSEATAASAAMQWALRDGTGMVGGLVFSYVASRHFDTHVKEFRLFADVINDVALTLDMLAPYAGQNWSLYVLSMSTIGKTLCGMSAGATKGRITQHFASHGNMADLSAKESTQETLVSLLGMLGGVMVAQILQHMPYSFTWILFGLLTLVHVWANYKGVKLLRLKTLNSARTSVVFKEILSKLAAGENREDFLQKAIQDLPCPEEIDESLASSTFYLLFPALHLSSPPHASHFEFTKEFMMEKYIIGYARGRKQLCVHLSVGATPEDELQAYLHAQLLQTKLLSGICIAQELIQSTLIQIKRLNRSLLWKELRDKGWDLDSRLYLGFGPQRFKWILINADSEKKFQ